MSSINDTPNELSLRIPKSRKKTLLEIAGVVENSVGLDVTFEDLSYTVQIKSKQKSPEKKRQFLRKNTVIDKRILSNCNGVFKSGRITAVMGASGAGKTSLLQVLASECYVGVVGGQIKVNGEQCVGSRMKKFCGFVFQDDVLSSTLTVREAIRMSAILRLPKDTDPQVREDRVTSIINLLELTKCADTLVGGEDIKGISGGERKRCAIGMELVTNPGVLYLDEPTTGLDTYTAFSVVQTLKRLAKLGKTVVATIHQPSSETFSQFDDVMFLSSGQVVYYGPSKEATKYFGDAGYDCPKFTNPADFIFMAVLTSETGKANNPYAGKFNADKSNEDRLLRLLKEWDSSDRNKVVKNEIVEINKLNKSVPQESFKQGADKWTQFTYLLHRYALGLRRSPRVLVSKVVQAVIIGLVVGLLFLNTDKKTGTTAIQNRVSIFFLLALQNTFNACFAILSVFCFDREIFEREYGAGYYKLLPFFASKNIVEMPGYLLMAIVQTPIVYFMAGLQTNAGKFFIAFLSTILCTLSGYSLGMAIASSVRQFEIALLMGPLILLPLALLSGLFVNQGTIPVFINWVKYLSPMKYGFEALAKNEFDGLTIEMSPGNYTTGQQQIDNLGLNDNLSIADCLGILFSMSVGLLMFSYFQLYRLTSAKSRQLVYKDMGKNSKKSPSAKED